jgi:hypothetical protein
MTPPITLTFLADDPAIGQELAMDSTDELRDAGYTLRPAPSGHMNAGQYLLELGQQVLDNKEFYIVLVTCIKTITESLAKHQQATPTAPTTRVEVVIVQGEHRVVIPTTTDDAALLRSLGLDPSTPTEIQTRIRDV